MKTAQGIRKARGPLKKNLEAIFYAGLSAASPEAAVRRALRLRGGILNADGLSYDLKKIKNIYLLGGGKASCRMAKAVEDILGERIAGGLIATKYGHGVVLERIKVVEAGHPIPDSTGLSASRVLLSIADAAKNDDLVICLFSGGASALLPAPSPGINLRDKQLATRLLVKSGATIEEINAVRKHLSEIKGGKLLKRIHPAQALTLIISDVVGDDPSAIASGPTAPDPSTFRDAVVILKKYGLFGKVPAPVSSHLGKGASGLIEETLKGKMLRENLVIANNARALEAAKAKAVSLGYSTIILSSAMTGSTREAARFFSNVLKEVKRTGNPLGPPACVIMGGETTLEVRGKGLGGRNQEFALVSAIELSGAEGAAVLSAGTDGTDGPTDAAGAFALPDTVRSAEEKGIDARKRLKENDSYNFFKALEGLFVTGPTGTNVMDIAIGLAQ